MIGSPGCVKFPKKEHPLDTFCIPTWSVTDSKSHEITLLGMLGRRDLEYLPHPRNTFLPLGSANATYNKLYRYVLYNISVPEALCVSTGSTNGYKWAIKWSTSALGTQAFELAILSSCQRHHLQITFVSLNAWQPVGKFLMFFAEQQWKVKASRYHHVSSTIFPLRIQTPP